MNGKEGGFQNRIWYIQTPNFFIMKRLFLLCFLFTAPFYLNAQTASYTVNGTELELRTDVKGSLTLLWNVIDQEYRYFIKKNDVIVEIINEKSGKKYTDSYKQQLDALTQDFPVNSDKTKLTLASLRKFVNTYNTQADPNYVSNSTVSKLDFRLGGFAGITNSIFTDNPENTSNSQLGVDFEISDLVALPRHSVVVQYKQTLSSEEFDFNSSQFSLNYRFKFVKSEKIDVFLNTKLVTYTRSSRGDTETDIEEEGEGEFRGINDGGNFQGPILFGLGADIALGKGFLTLNYHDAYSFFLDDNGEFPVDVSIGYKFNL